MKRRRWLDRSHPLVPHCRNPSCNEFSCDCRWARLDALWRALTRIRQNEELEMPEPRQSSRAAPHSSVLSPLR